MQSSEKYDLLDDLRRNYFTEDLSVDYTLLSDDITEVAKPQGTPYVSRAGISNKYGYNAETDLQLTVEKRYGGYMFTLVSHGDSLSE